MIRQGRGTIGEIIEQVARAARISMLRRLMARMSSLESIDHDRFLLAPAVGAFDRVYGGQSLAEAMLAAARTVADGRHVNSAQCHFLRLGDPALPIVYIVDRLQDTRSFSVRHLRVEQDGKPIIIATFSFAAVAKEQFVHQWAMPETRPPEQIASRDVELLTLYQGRPPQNAGVPWPVDLRHVDRPPWDRSLGDGHQRIWMRADEALPDDPLLHAALLLYASDLTMVDAITARHPLDWEDLIAGRGMFGATLSHCFWLHTSVRFDQWLLHVQESSRAAGGRGFATGRFFDEAGMLIASVAQEIFIKAMPQGKRT